MLPHQEVLFEADPQPHEVRIVKAARHAEHVYRTWIDQAVGYVALHATVHTFFTCSDIRVMAEKDGFRVPPDERAWGHIMRIAKQRGLCVAERVMMVDGAYRTQWRSLVRQDPTCAKQEPVF